MFNSNIFNGRVFNIGLNRPAGGYERYRKKEEPLTKKEYMPAWYAAHEEPKKVVRKKLAVDIAQIDPNQEPILLLWLDS